jgi:hypothetical protein
MCECLYSYCPLDTSKTRNDLCFHGIGDEQGVWTTRKIDPELESVAKARRSCEAGAVGRRTGAKSARPPTITWEHQLQQRDLTSGSMASESREWAIAL